jgi:hypothetical protein
MIDIAPPRLGGQHFQSERMEVENDADAVVMHDRIVRLSVNNFDGVAG